MQTKEIEVNGRKYTVKELKYKDVIAIKELSQADAAKKLMVLSTEMSDEVYDELSVNDGIEIQKFINELNNFSQDFPVPPTANPKE